MNVRSFYSIFSVLILLCFQPLAQATIGQQRIHDEVEKFVLNIVSYNEKMEKIDINIGQLDSRLLLTDCAHPLRLKRQGKPSQHKRLLIKVSCAGPKPWSVYVPVAVNKFTRVLVASRTLPREHLIQAADLILQEIDVSTVSGSYTTDASTLIGKVTKRPIRAGKIVDGLQLTAAKVIKRGDEVFISASRGAISVQMVAVALSDGKLGQRINVRNKNSRKIVHAEVLGPGRVAAVM